LKKIIILGSSGSIGQTAITVAQKYPEYIEITALHAHSNKTALLHDAGRLNVGVTALTAAGNDNDVTYCGHTALERLIKESDADMVLNGIAGAAGLESSFWVLESGKDLALANKESLVMAGPLLRRLAAQNKRLLLPVDSEHSAVFTLLQQRRAADIDEIILTASGGPFRDFPQEKLALVTPEEAASHPTWKMGRKISIDSASLANKGLEVIEAWRFFDTECEKIKVLQHRQSMVHSLVRTADGALYAQISRPDMTLPIQNALLYPHIKPAANCFLDLAGHALTFEEVDSRRFPLLKLAYAACKAGDPYPIVYNAANEIAVEHFCRRQITFDKLHTYVEKALDYDYGNFNAGDMQNIQAVDKLVRRNLSKGFTQ
jgi:1-deoxy-D-xylulose-5-phosphate reductoisomerase